MARYYVKIVGRAFGPLESERIAKMIADGKLNRDSEVSSNKLDWRPLKDVSEFQSAFGSGLPGAAPIGNAPTPTSSAASQGAVWYVTTNGADQYGPMTQEQILAALRGGRLSVTARAWRQGEQARPIGEIPEFSQGSPAPVEKKEWYYSTDGQTGYGPYGVSEILAFVEQGRANFDSLVWRQGENSRPMRVEQAFMNAYNASHASMPAPPIPSPATQSVVTQPVTTAKNFDTIPSFVAEKLNRSLKTWRSMVLICFIVSMVLAIAPIVGVIAVGVIEGSTEEAQWDGSNDPAASFGCIRYPVLETRRTTTLSSRVTAFNMAQFPVALNWKTVSLSPSNVVFGMVGSYIHLSILGLAGLSGVSWLLSLVAMLAFTHSFWASIPRRYARTNPIAATLLLLVPLFNIYWIFVAFRGGSIDIDLALRDYVLYGLNHNEEPNYAGTNGGTAFVVFWICCLISVVFIPFITLAFFFCVGRMQKAAYQMNCWRAGLETTIPGQREPKVTLDDIMNS